LYLDSPSSWKWVEATTTSLINVSPVPSDVENPVVIADYLQRVCDYHHLPGFRFIDGNLGQNFVSALDFYINNFQSPFISNPVVRQHFNTDLYSGPSGHNGVDIVHKLSGVNGDSTPFPVVAPYSGVVVDVGPDAFVETYKIERVFGSIDDIQPDWVKTCVVKKLTARACKNGVYIEVTRPDLNAPPINVFIMFSMTAYHLGLNNFSDYIRHDGWTGENYGLPSIDDIDKLLYNNEYNDLCGGPCNRPGSQIVVQYDTDGDNVAEISTTYLHTAEVTNPEWQNKCAAKSEQYPGFRSLHEMWSLVYNDSSCHVGTNQELGMAQNIGFSSAPHLHYTVYIDRNENGEFIPGDDETIDPLIARSMSR
jgi:hypothetical protein